MLTVNDFKTERLPTWCPGCGDYGIWMALKNALIELSMGSDKAAFVFDIGCNSNMYDATRLTSFEGLHGRTLPVAEGIRSANPNLPVICIAGDGGCLGEGGNHFIHAARRNYDITLLLFDNQVYGLTTGQTSPTTPLFTKTKSTPEGSIEYPLNPLSLALSTDASFIARGFAGDIPNLTKLIVKAITHKGFSLLDIMQPCVSFNHAMSYQWYRDRVYYLPEEYKTDNKVNAYKTLLEFPEDIASPPIEGKKIPIGIFYEMDRPTYEEEYLTHSKTLQTKSILSQSIDNIVVESLIEEFT